MLIVSVEAAYQKAQIYLEAGCVFSEFGTRRRRSYHIQDLVVGTLIRANKDFPTKGKLMGTSNVGSLSIGLIDTLIRNLRFTSQ